MSFCSSFCCGAKRKNSVEGVGSSFTPIAVLEAPSKARLHPMDQLPNKYRIDWTSAGLLGSGHFAKVFQGVALNKNKDKVAAKRIRRAGSKTSTLKTEISVMAHLSHPNIVQLYDAYCDDLFVVLILEFLGGGELFHRIAKFGAYSEIEARKHFLSLAQACAYMHSAGVVHRDLKPENLILVEPRMDSPIKISDFGLAKLITDDSSAMSTVCGTKAYGAPEVNFGNDPLKRGLEYSAKVDVWSMGVILYVMLGGFHPFDPFGRIKDDVLRNRIMQGDFDFDDKVWATISAEAKDLLMRMLMVDAESRLSMDQVCAHKWFARLMDTSIPLLTGGDEEETKDRL